MCQYFLILMSNTNEMFDKHVRKHGCCLQEKIGKSWRLVKCLRVNQDPAIKCKEAIGKHRPLGGITECSSETSARLAVTPPWKWSVSPRERMQTGMRSLENVFI